MKHKVGRPTTTTKVAPPGQKYCKKKEHFVRTSNFRGDDNYCIECRREYNKAYWAENNKPKEHAEIAEKSVDAICHCGEYITFSESGEFTCPSCGLDWNVNMTIRIVR
jgi:hypothetical protein